MENLVKGIASFDGDVNTYMTAYADVNQKMNGFACPYIHEGFIAFLLEMINGGDSTYIFENDLVHSIYGDDYRKIISPTLIDGEKYYYLGEEGICFDFEPLAKIEKDLANLKSKINFINNL